MYKELTTNEFYRYIYNVNRGYRHDYLCPIQRPIDKKRYNLLCYKYGTKPILDRLVNSVKIAIIKAATTFIYDNSGRIFYIDITDRKTGVISTYYIGNSLIFDSQGSLLCAFLKDDFANVDKAKFVLLVRNDTLGIKGLSREINLIIDYYRVYSNVDIMLVTRERIMELVNEQREVNRQGIELLYTLGMEVVNEQVVVDINTLEEWYNELEEETQTEKKDTELNEDTQNILETSDSLNALQADTPADSTTTQR